MTRILILVENLPVPFDRRVWQESCALGAGDQVVVICSMGDRCDIDPEIVLDGVRILRYPLRAAIGGPSGYARKDSLALLHTRRPAPAFAKAVDVLLNDPEDWTGRSALGRARVAEQLSRAISREQLIKPYESPLGQANGRSG
jgi:hypothetical protein